MKAIIILANAVQPDGESGTAHALGAGWSVANTPTDAIGLILLIDVPWDQTNRPHDLVIELCDADGHLFTLTTPTGENLPAARVERQFEVGRPVGAPPGSPIRHCLTLAVAPGLPLVSGQKYEFRLTINGEVMDSWLSTFTVNAVGI